MKTNLIQNLILAGALTLSLAACQKSSDANSSSVPTDMAPAPKPTPTPVETETTVEKPKTALQVKDEAEAQLQTVGLKFMDPYASEDIELFMIEAKWDVNFYRNFLRQTKVRPTLEMQIQLLKAYTDAVDAFLAQDLTVEPQDMENESVEDLLRLAEHRKYEARLELSQARLTKLEQRLEARQKKEAAAIPTQPEEQKPVEKK
jgi:hypothetical protein